MYLLDTNIISDTRRPERTNSGLQQWLADKDPAAFYTSAIVMMELERGVLGIERKDQAQGAILRQWLEDTVKPAFSGRILPIDEATAEICAALHIPDRSPENDAWIAATAKQHRLILVTRNTADFERTGVKLFNPFTD
ncbi:type II toxin-antitoxin system VapC family toxin [Bergeriella denitrificans]|uniref:Ribonuclease VapC n=1 Tax=Bergeriella denitrificans TaxID=494 RepID=A0A378UJF8_BERDE|nr:type II toxin-antitoxin system VapC family toxin [Bergeriella denitrificans]STZ76863.1 PilT protein-like protein [Bergeriella denitrificans]